MDKTFKKILLRSKQHGVQENKHQDGSMMSAFFCWSIGTTTWYNPSTSWNIKMWTNSHGGDRALWWVSNVHKHL